MRIIKLTLGDNEYEIKFTFNYSSAWRKRVEPELQHLIKQVQQMQDFTLDSVQDLVPAMQQFLPLLLEAPDRIAELVVASSPVLEEKKSEIFEEADEDQLIDAFIVLVKAAYPFSKLAALLPTKSSPDPKSGKNGSGAGQEGNMTSTNSPGQNGESSQATPALTN